jgi:PPK2 family polyphosphate:nucleotide phosphotransferase
VTRSAAHRYRVSTDGSFQVDDASTRPPKGAKADKRATLQKRQAVLHEKLRDLQARLYAFDRHSLLVIFQAMDAAGKDGTIKAVMSGVNPAGCQVFSFKAPSAEELDHDFLWRAARALPERGRIGIFNRSYYEEVLVVRVHPELLVPQHLPGLSAQPSKSERKRLWKDRYESIRAFESHLVRNGTTVVKFWLNVSKDEQRRRFLGRLVEPEKNWKFSARDVRERAHWDTYMTCYEEALRATSTEDAPWYVIPADDKAYMRIAVSEILVETLEGMDLDYPRVDEAERAAFDELFRELEAEGTEG